MEFDYIVLTSQRFIQNKIFESKCIIFYVLLYFTNCYESGFRVKFTHREEKDMDVLRIRHFLKSIIIAILYLSQITQIWNVASLTIKCSVWNYLTLRPAQTTAENIRRNIWKCLRNLSNKGDFTENHKSVTCHTINLRNF